MNTIKPSQDKTVEKKQIECGHSLAIENRGHSSKQFYCPHCHLCMTFDYITNKYTKFYEIQPHLI